MGYASAANWRTIAFEPETWTEFVADVQRIIANPPDHALYTLYAEYPVRICGPNGTGNPIVGEQQISFNGDTTTHVNRDISPNAEEWLIGRDLAHDSFHLRPDDLKHPNGWFGCKTDGKPYDVVAKAILIRLRHYFPSISLRMGERGEWAQAFELCRTLFGDPQHYFGKYYRVDGQPQPFRYTRWFTPEAAALLTEEGLPHGWFEVNATDFDSPQAEAMRAMREMVTPTVEGMDVLSDPEPVLRNHICVVRNRRRH